MRNCVFDTKIQDNNLFPQNFPEFSRERISNFDKYESFNW